MGSTWTWRRRKLSAGTRGGPLVSPSKRRRRALEAEAEGRGAGQQRTAASAGRRGGVVPVPCRGGARWGRRKGQR